MTSSTSFSQQKLLDCLADVKGFAAKFKDFKSQFTQQRQDFIHLSLSLLIEELVKAGPPMRKMHVLRAIKEAVNTGSFGVLQIVESQVLPILEATAVYKAESPDQDRGKTMFLREMKDPSEKGDLQKIGNSYLRMVLECIEVWAIIKPYFVLRVKESPPIPSGFSHLFRRLKEEVKVTFPDKKSYYKEDDVQKFRRRYLDSLEVLANQPELYTDYYSVFIDEALESEKKLQDPQMGIVVDVLRIPDILLEENALDIVERRIKEDSGIVGKVMALRGLSSLFSGGSINVIDRVQYKIFPYLMRMVKELDGRKDLGRGSKLSTNNPVQGEMFYGEILKTIVLLGQSCPRDPLNNSETMLFKSLVQLQKLQYQLPIVVQLADFKRTLSQNLAAKLYINELSQRQVPPLRLPSTHPRVQSFESQRNIMEIMCNIKLIYKELSAMKTEEEKADGFWVKQVHEYLSAYNKGIEGVLEDNLELSNFDIIANEIYDFMEKNIQIIRLIQEKGAYGPRLKKVQEVIAGGDTPEGVFESLQSKQSIGKVYQNGSKQNMGSYNVLSEDVGNASQPNLEEMPKRSDRQEGSGVVGRSSEHPRSEMKLQSKKLLKFPHHESLDKPKEQPRQQQQSQQYGSVSSSELKKQDKEKKEEKEVIAMYERKRDEDIKSRLALSEVRKIYEIEEYKPGSRDSSIIDAVFDSNRQSQVSNNSLPLKDNNQSLIRKPGSATQKNRIGGKKDHSSLMEDSNHNISRRSIQDVQKNSFQNKFEVAMGNTKDEGRYENRPETGNFKKNKLNLNLNNIGDFQEMQPVPKSTLVEGEENINHSIEEPPQRLTNRSKLEELFKVEPSADRSSSRGPSPARLLDEQNSEIMEPGLEPMGDSFHEVKEEMRQQLSKLTTSEMPQFNACFEAQKYLIPNKAFAGEAKKFWLQQDAKMLTTFNRSINGGDSSLSQRFNSNSTLSIPEILSEQNKHFEVELQSMREQHKKEIAFLENKVRKLERHNKEQEKALTEQREELDSFKGAHSDINFGATFKSQQQEFLEHENQVLKNRLDRETRSFMQSKNLSPAAFSDGFGMSGQLSRMKPKINKGHIFPTQPYLQFFSSLADSKVKKPMLKNKDILAKTQTMEVGFIASKEKSCLRVALFFQSETNNVSEVKMLINNKGLSLDCYPSEIPTEMKAGKQERYVVVMLVDQQLTLPYEIPQVEIKYKVNEQGGGQRLRFLIPLTFNRLLQYSEVDTTKFKSIYKQNVDHILRGEQISYNKRVMKDVLSIKQLLPKLQTLNPLKQSLFFEGKSTLKFGVSALYEPLNFHFLIKINVKPGNMLYIQTIPLLKPSNHRVVEEFLICTINHLLRREKVWA